MKRESPKPMPLDLLRRAMVAQERKNPALAAKQRRLLQILARKRIAS